MSEKPNVLIIGGNRGLGLEWTKQWLERSANVFATAREPEKSRDLHSLRGKFPNTLQILQVDVSSDDSIKSLAGEFGETPLDILIHNSGIGGRVDLDNPDTEKVIHVFNVNSVGALRTVSAFRKNLKMASGRGKIALITSLMGSIDDNRSGGSYAYRMSKAALNMAGKSMSVDLAADDIDVILLHPGWVRTDMGGSSARISTGESVSGMMKILDKLDASISGTFWHTNGQELEW